ncbi:MAG: hypothetical protein KDD22_03770 [Bdellovibrionales bacterium]|nr:hypothetical protein [Bdellovibrionales bacterium]
MQEKNLRISQLELDIQRTQEPDRNFFKGGRSFYFFDFDDNVAFLSTPAVIFHQDTGEEIEMSSALFAHHNRNIGKSGPYRHYRIDYDEQKGTFRNFRDKDISRVARWMGQRQTFVQDLAAALGKEDFRWKGPSWSCFYHAVFNQRPISLITARGHHPKTLKEGIQCFVRSGHLPSEPNYLSLFPVSHPEVKKNLGHEFDTPISKLKQTAIRASVKKALQVYGESPHHRFGMSDDDPENVRLIIDEMARLKGQYPRNSFYVIETHKGQFLKREIFTDHTEDKVVGPNSQLSLFRW